MARQRAVSSAATPTPPAAEATLPQLLKRASTGKAQQWDIAVEPNDDGTATIITRYGQVGGKIREDREVIREGKNIGKANETTPLQQARLEAEAAWNEKKDRKKYALTVEESAVKRSLAPMLAEKYEDYRDRVDWSTSFAQPKLDGFRCLARRIGSEITFESREGKPITTLGHLVELLRYRMEDGATWDGELYVPGVTFQKVSSWIKRQQPDSERLEYHVYDMPGRDCFGEPLPPLPFRERYEQVRAVLRPSDKLVVPVKTIQVYTEEDLMMFQSDCIAEGFEGAMLRYGLGGYEASRRSRSLLKVKTFEDAEFKIVGVKEGRGTFEGMAVFQCLTPAGHAFDCTAPGTHEEKRNAWAYRDGYIGKSVTVKYQGYTTTDTPVPRFPVAKAVVG